LGGKSRMGRKLRKFNSNKTGSSSEKINKDESKEMAELVPMKLKKKASKCIIIDP
jgi:hypothetical protein